MIGSRKAGIFRLCEYRLLLSSLGGREVVPFLEVLDGMVKRGVEVRLIHAKDPGPNWWDAPGRTSSTIVEDDDVFRCDSITVDDSL